MHPGCKRVSQQQWVTRVTIEEYVCVLACSPVATPILARHQLQDIHTVRPPKQRCGWLSHPLHASKMKPCTPQSRALVCMYFSCCGISPAFWEAHAWSPLHTTMCAATGFRYNYQHARLAFVETSAPQGSWGTFGAARGRQPISRSQSERWERRCDLPTRDAQLFSFTRVYYSQSRKTVESPVTFAHSLYNAIAM